MLAPGARTTRKAAEWIERVDRLKDPIVESTRHSADFLNKYFDVDGEPLQ